jgi:RNA polymerase sigma-70 factor (ECF subfamily)
MAPQDISLLAGIAAGDREAFAAFYDQHSAAVFALAVQLLGQGADAEDALQETFWQVWRQANRYEPGRATPRTWLVMIARSRCIDHLRRRRLAAEPTGTPQAVEANPSMDPLEQGELTEAIRAALSCLPPVQREAIELAFFRGMTHQQVAMETSVALGTAKTRIRLAMQRLRDVLSTPRDEVPAS